MRNETEGRTEYIFGYSKVPPLRNSGLIFQINMLCCWKLDRLFSVKFLIRYNQNLTKKNLTSCITKTVRKALLTVTACHTNMTFYNIPRACLLNRSQVPAMDLKSNRSGLWHHITGTCRRLRWLCRKHSNIGARHDKTPSFMSRRSGIMLWLLYIKKLQYMHFHFDYFFRVATYDIIFAVVRYIIKHLFDETAWSILFWNHKNDVTSL